MANTVTVTVVVNTPTNLDADSAQRIATETSQHVSRSLGGSTIVSATATSS